MLDAGQGLRNILKKEFNESLFAKGIEQFILLQLEAAKSVDELLELGVPDWRLNKIPDLYKKLLSMKDLLLQDGLREKEVNQMQDLLPKVTHLCDSLSKYHIKQTIVQPDCSDNNILLDNVSQKLTIIDLGEIVISHPFFSLANYLRQLVKHYPQKEIEQIYTNVKNSALYKYLNYEVQLLSF